MFLSYFGGNPNCQKSNMIGVRGIPQADEISLDHAKIQVRNKTAAVCRQKLADGKIRNNTAAVKGCYPFFVCFSGRRQVIFCIKQLSFLALLPESLCRLAEGGKLHEKQRALPRLRVNARIFHTNRDNRNIVVWRINVVDDNALNEPFVQKIAYHVHNDTSF